MESIIKGINSLFYGWVIVLLSFLIAAVAWGSQYSFGVLLKPILTEFGWTRAEISGAYSLANIVIGLLGFITGSLTDRFGPRLVLTVCGLCLGIGYLLLSQVNSIWQIYLVYGVLIGVALAGVWVPLVSTVARWFTKRRGLTSGIVASGIGAGVTTAPLVMSFLVTNYGWRVTCIVIGLLALIVFIISAQFMKRDPRDIGQSAYGADILAGNVAIAATLGFTPMEAIRTRQFWLISVVFFLFGFCVHTVMIHIVPHATDIGISAGVAATVLSTIGIISIFSKVGMGVIIDRLHGRRVILIISILLLFPFLWLQFAAELWMLYLFAAVFAIGYGGTAALPAPIVAEYFKLKSHGAILGLCIFSLLIGSALGPLVAALIYDLSGTYYPAFIICIIFSILNIILAILLKPPKH